jgi:hypothetical protein
VELINLEFGSMVCSKIQPNKKFFQSIIKD